MNHTSILQSALIDYTDWLLKQKAEILGSNSELRGIFYNKLIARLRELYSVYDLRSAIKPEDIFITFRLPGFIIGLAFNAEAYTAYQSERAKILYGLNDALKRIDVLDYHSPLSYELTKIISELKKL